MQTQTKCHACGSLNVKLQRGQIHHFTESGLENVFLVNVDTYRCPDCKEDFVSIPRPMELLNCIAEALLRKPGLLAGPEIRFLRKNRCMKLAEFAQLIGHTRVALSRWENGKREVSKAADRAIRLAYLANSNVSRKLREDLIEAIQKEHEGAPQKLEYQIRFPLKKSSCQIRSNAA